MHSPQGDCIALNVYLYSTYQCHKLYLPVIYLTFMINLMTFMIPLIINNDLINYMITFMIYLTFMPPMRAMSL